MDEPLVQYYGASTATSERRYLHTDHQGSIVAQSNSSGILISQQAYDTFGIPDARNIDSFGYTGQLWLKELGLYYYKARMYHPKLGRFLQTDPIFYADDMNMYAYVGNDPVNNRDPSGLECTGTGDKGRCTIDKAKIDGKWVKLDQKARDGLAKSDPGLLKAIGKLEGNITAGYKEALAAGSSSVNIRGNASLGIKELSFTGNAIAQRMTVSEHSLDNQKKYYGDNPKNKEVMVHRETTSELRFFKGAVDASDYLQKQGALHDTLHLMPEAGVWDAYPDEHQQPFNDAVDQLLR